jgi:putative peptidoglycan lipid II flippase
MTESQAAPAIAEAGPSLARSGGLIIVLSVITLALGFGVQMALAARLGTSRAMDVYLVAITLPALGATVAVTVFPSALVPVLRGRLAAQDSLQGDSIFRFAFTLAAVVGMAAAIGVSAGAAFIVRVTAPGLVGADAEMAAGLLQVTAFGLAFDVPRGVLTARQYALQRYLAPQAAPSLNHMILLACALILLPRLGLGVMAAAWTAGSAAMLALLLLPSLHPLTRPGVPAAGWASLASLPAVLVVAVLTQATPVVDRWVASTLPEGAIASLGYGSKILEVMMRTLPMGLGLALFPLLSEHAARKRWVDFGEVAARTSRWLWLGTVPLTLVVVMLRQSWVVLLFERGDFDRASSVAVAQALLWYGLAFIPASGAYFLSRAHYALQDTRPLVQTAAMSLLGTLVLDLVFARKGGFAGIAAANLVVTSLAGAYLAARLWRQRLLPPPSFPSIASAGRVTAALLMALILAVAGSRAGELLEDRNQLALLVVISGCLSLALYVATLVVFRDPEVERVLRWVHPRLANMLKARRP